MDWDGEIYFDGVVCTARCFIGGCDFQLSRSGYAVADAVRLSREDLTAHRLLAEHKLGRAAKVNLVFADGVTV